MSQVRGEGKYTRVAVALINYPDIQVGQFFRCGIVIYEAVIYRLTRPNQIWCHSESVGRYAHPDLTRLGERDYDDIQDAEKFSKFTTQLRNRSTSSSRVGKSASSGIRSTKYKIELSLFLYFVSTVVFVIVFCYPPSIFCLRDRRFK